MRKFGRLCSCKFVIFLHIHDKRKMFVAQWAHEVEMTNLRRIDVSTTSFERHVPAGLYDLYYVQMEMSIRKAASI